MENPSSGSRRFVGDSNTLFEFLFTQQKDGSIQGRAKLEGAQENRSRSNKSKCQVLHPGQGKASHEHRQGEELLGSSPGDEDFGAGG